MLISNSNKFIFVKTKKTAGTSVQNLLKRFCMNRGDIVSKRANHERGYYNSYLHPHAKALEIISKFGENVWNDYFTFSIVRHPVDRMISEYFWSINRSKNPLIFNNFYEFLKSNHARNTCNYPILYTNGYKEIDYLIRYESISEDIKTLLHKLGFNFDNIELPKEKTEQRTDRRHWKDFVTDKELEYIKENYFKEISLHRKLGYEL